MQQLHTPSQAAQWLKDRVRGHLQSDSRTVRPGDGFIAWPGAAVDGRQFVSNALALGATACLVEAQGVDAFALASDAVASYPDLKRATGGIASAFYGDPSRDLSVVAVTGTNGKTSTAWWLAQALQALAPPACQPCGLIGTLGVGRPPAALRPDGTAQDGGAGLVPTGLTTPDPVLLQRTLKGFVDQGLQACAIEASSIGIAEHRLDGTQVRVAVFTNFTIDHLDYHGSMEAYWSAKRALFSWPDLHAAVVNLDDARGSELAAELQNGGLDLWTVSASAPARLCAHNVAYHHGGISFDVLEGGSTCPLQTRVIGAYNVINLLGVIAVMRSLGVPLAQAVQACSQLQAVPGRMEWLEQPGQPLVAVDYAHTPDALSHALAALGPVVQARGGELWCVFGCGGDRDPSKRPLMGAIAARQADHVVVTSDNPRSEKTEAIISQILLGLPSSSAVEVQAERSLAITQTIARAAPGDVILLAGKGHEETQEIAGRKTPFSDRSWALEGLKARVQQGLGVQS